jgi:8-oxo-dGTP pyrophosphatase MutT (NUDIX family)
MPHTTDTMPGIEAALGASLGTGLPGFAVQKAMSPRSLDGTFARGPGGPPGKPAAALALLYPRDGVPHLVLTVRSDHLPHHGGQISLPGGGKTESESIEEAALRETREEIGVASDAIRVLGRLTSVFIPPSGFRLHPVAGIAEEPLRFRPDPTEVARILEVPVRDLESPDARGRESKTLRGAEFEIPFFRVGEHRVWGATAMVLAELLWALGAEGKG